MQRGLNLEWVEGSHGWVLLGGSANSTDVPFHFTRKLMARAERIGEFVVVGMALYSLFGQI
jgi:hypothetical protein